jgi:hypothetical protein
MDILSHPTEIGRPLKADERRAKLLDDAARNGPEMFEITLVGLFLNPVATMVGRGAFFFLCLPDVGCLSRKF